MILKESGIPSLPTNSPKELATLTISNSLLLQGFDIVEMDNKRPWGAFYKISEEQLPQFLDTFFPGVDIPDNVKNLKIDPKILLVESGKRLSWQFHNRRSEFWRVIQGPVGVVLNHEDSIPERVQILSNGERVDISSRTRHRLVGLRNWGVVAELWIHEDPLKPSNEEDIVRLADDFGRENK